MSKLYNPGLITLSYFVIAISIKSYHTECLSDNNSESGHHFPQVPQIRVHVIVMGLCYGKMRQINDHEMTTYMYHYC